MLAFVVGGVDTEPEPEPKPDSTLVVAVVPEPHPDEFEPPDGVPVPEPMAGVVGRLCCRDWYNSSNDPAFAAFDEFYKGEQEKRVEDVSRL